MKSIIKSNSIIGFFMIVSGIVFISSCSLFYPAKGNYEIRINPANAILQPGSTLQFQATKITPNGHTENISNAAEWKTSEPGVAVVSSSGIVEAISPGVSAVAAILDRESGGTMMSVLDPEATSAPLGSTPLPVLGNPGFESPGYIDSSTLIPPNESVPDYVPCWNLSVGGIEGLYNTGINTNLDTEAGSNYLYLGQENISNVNPVTMYASSDTAVTVTQTTTFILRYKILDFEGDSNHSDFEYPIRIRMIVNGQDCYLFLRSSKSDGGEKSEKGIWKSAEIPLLYLSIPKADSHGSYRINEGDQITRIIIEPKGKHWGIYIDHIDIVL